MPQVGFLPADDPRVIGTIAAVERELLQGGLVMRYSTNETDDGVGGREGAFLACSFWLADAYVLTGRRQDAQRLFDPSVGRCPRWARSATDPQRPEMCCWVSVGWQARFPIV
nr:MULTISPECIES: glycoside hydrolase family 15 protein [Rhizobium]